VTLATIESVALASNYGGDANGLICGFHFPPDGTVAPVDSAAAVALLRQLAADAQGGFVWLHFNIAHTAAEPWLRAHSGLDDSFYDALHEGSRSTRIERALDTLFSVVNDITFDFAFEASDVATLWISARAHAVITVRRSPLRSIDALRTAVRRGEHVGSAVALLDHLLRDQADELQRIARQASDRVDDIEDALLAGRTDRLTLELSQLRRMSVRLQRLLAPEPGAFFRMLANPPLWVAPTDRQRLQQASEEFSVVLRDIASLQERIKLLQDESAARVAEENNRSLFILTMVTVLALPINLVSGLMGMNVGGVPLNQHPFGYWIVVSLIAMVTVTVGWFAVQRLGPRR
jgi:zinc transporter